MMSDKKQRERDASACRYAAYHSQPQSRLSTEDRMLKNPCPGVLFAKDHDLNFSEIDRMTFRLQ